MPTSFVYKFYRFLFIVLVVKIDGLAKVFQLFSEIEKAFVICLDGNGDFILTVGRKHFHLEKHDTDLLYGMSLEKPRDDLPGAVSISYASLYDLSGEQFT